MSQKTFASPPAENFEDLPQVSVRLPSIAVAICDHDFTVRSVNPALGELLARADLSMASNPAALHVTTVLRLLGVSDVARAMIEISSSGCWQSIAAIRSSEFGVSPHRLHVAAERLHNADDIVSWLITANAQPDFTVSRHLNERELISVSEKLTPREQQVTLALHAGASNKRIGLDLQISPRTVEFHRARIMKRFDANSVVDLVRKVTREARYNAWQRMGETAPGSCQINVTEAPVGNIGQR